MTFFRNEPGFVPRVLLLGGTSEIGLAILAALDLPADADVILAGRDEQRLAAAGKELSGQIRASQVSSQLSIRPSLVSRSSTGAAERRPVSTANRIRAAASGRALSRCQLLASGRSPAAQAR